MLGLIGPGCKSGWRCGTSGRMPDLAQSVATGLDQPPTGLESPRAITRREDAMPVRTGAQYLADLRQHKTEVWLRGERVTDPTTHRGLAGGARAIASLYDLQTDPAHRDAMTFI